MTVFYVTVLGDETKWVWCPLAEYDNYQSLVAERDEALSAFAQVREEKRVAVLDLIAEKMEEVKRWIKAERERDEARDWARRLKAERDAIREQYDALLKRAAEAQAFRYAGEED